MKSHLCSAKLGYSRCFQPETAELRGGYTMLKPQTADIKANSDMSVGRPRKLSESKQPTNSFSM